MIRVVVADDHHLVREGICSLLARNDDIQVVGQASDGVQAVELVEQLAPDALVVDISMPNMDGIQATKHVRTRGDKTQVIILSMYADRPLVRQALRSGARGYVLKKSVSEELVLAVRAAFKRETFLSPAISDTILEEFLASPEENDSPAERLTPRERQVLQLIAEGHTNKSIAKQLCISEKTVEKHRANLMEKLGAHNLADLLREARKYRLIFED